MHTWNFFSQFEGMDASVESARKKFEALDGVAKENRLFIVLLISLD